MNNPQVPNQDQLVHITPRNDPNNAARYEDAPPEREFPSSPVITISPNAVYLVDPGYTPE